MRGKMKQASFIQLRLPFRCSFSCILSQVPVDLKREGQKLTTSSHDVLPQSIEKLRSQTQSDWTSSSNALTGCSLTATPGKLPFCRNFSAWNTQGPCQSRSSTDPWPHEDLRNTFLLFQHQIWQNSRPPSICPPHSCSKDQCHEPSQHLSCQKSPGIEKLPVKTGHTGLTQARLTNFKTLKEEHLKFTTSTLDHQNHLKSEELPWPFLIPCPTLEEKYGKSVTFEAT